MESLVNIAPEHWQDQSVFLTGHTGFKGGWLSLWLQQLGARVHGYALDPPTTPAFFDAAQVATALASDVRADLGDGASLRSALQQAQPRVVFHLAAQSLVRESYRDALGTFATNAMGTANLLEAVRGIDTVRAVVLITTDKVYLNREWNQGYREADHLGGHDPYSASKAAAEIIAASYRASFFTGPHRHPAQVATARAGNVIGGGDWANDRLVPDGLRAFATGAPLRLRYPDAVRPWQHVLEPLAGYLQLAQRLLSPEGERFARAWNFGPDEKSEATVVEVAQILARAWGDGARVEAETRSGHPHEAGLLRLDSSAARDMLSWRPRWSLAQAVEQTVAWQRAMNRGDDMAAVSRGQIRAYMAASA